MMTFYDAELLFADKVPGTAPTFPLLHPSKSRNDQFFWKWSIRNNRFIRYTFVTELRLTAIGMHVNIRSYSSFSHFLVIARLRGDETFSGWFQTGQTLAELISFDNL